MSVIGSNALAGASGQAGAAGYEIERSLRFNSVDSSHLSKTPSSAGNRRTWTWSGWVKKTASAATDPKTLFGVYGGSASTSFTLRFDPSTDDTLRVENDFTVGAPGGRTVAVFRDYSGWMHVVVSMDTTQSSAASGLKMYVNGVQQTLQNTVWTQNIETLVNSTNAHYIGSQGQANSYLDGYLADVHFIDGQALAPTDFGESDTNGVWQPIEYTGTYGTNGFHLDFSDNSSNAALGTDSSGNNNDWTVNNITAEAPGLATAKQGMDIVTYTGNGSTQTISSLQFQPDLVWIKRRDGTNGHRLQDVIRGTNYLESNTTAAEVDAIDGGVTAFNSDGFTIGAGSSYNSSSALYVAWCWKAGGTASSNTDGSITSQVSANTTYGFSVVTWTGQSSGSATIGHGLNAAPEFIILKGRTGSVGWTVGHESIGWTKRLQLNTTAAATTSSNYWNNTAPTSSVFTSGANNVSNTFVAYCWSEVAGFSKFGSYTGTGAVGHKITTGFKPAYILFKRTDSLSNWRIVDEKRGTSSLNAETNEAEQTLNFAINADGFTINETGNNPNASGGTYIYAAFAGTPAGEDLDSLFDSPTNGTQTDTGLGGEVSGNYATLNPLTLTLGASSSGTLSNGNLEWLGTGNNDNVAATFAASSGKFYYEVQPTANVNNLVAGWTTTEAVTHTTVTALFYYESAGIRAGTKTSVWNTDVTTGLSFANNDILGFAIDIDGGELKVYQNNVLKSTITLPTDKGDTWIPCLGDSSATDASAIVNFGQRAFAYTAPSGFKALNTANLSDPTIADGSTAMDATLWTGNGSTQTISGFDFSPDFVWVKQRNTTRDHRLANIISGTGKDLRSNATNAEVTDANGITAFNSDGFSVGSSTGWNQSSGTYVGWAWDAGTSTVSNTNGSITSSVRANPSAGFSIVSYSGTGAAATVGHGLNAAPKIVIFKNRDAATNWRVYTTMVDGSMDSLFLNTTAAKTDSSLSAFTSSVFYCGTNPDHNGSGQAMIAYCFAPVEGYSAFGSYTGNGSTDGPFVYTGHRSRWLMVKRTDTSGYPWVIVDALRDGYNVTYKWLEPNSSSAEQSAQPVADVDFLSNGFKMRGGGNTTNQSAGTYIYAAFAENPFKYARAR